MKKQKTVPNNSSVIDFLALIEDDKKKKDAYTLLRVCETKSGFPPTMWGSSIIGFGSCHYIYPSTHEGDTPLISFCPRKNNFSIYLAVGNETIPNLLLRLGKHKMGVGCLYIKHLSDIDLSVLEEIIDESINFLKNNYEVTAP